MRNANATIINNSISYSNTERRSNRIGSFSAASNYNTSYRIETISTIENNERSIPGISAFLHYRKLRHIGS